MHGSVSRGQALLSTSALGVALAVLSVHLLLSDLVVTASRVGGTALLAIAAALLATIATPSHTTTPARVKPPLPRR
jgi:hypothetical protein